MTQVFRAANLVRELPSEDIRVLKGIELGMRRYQFVPLEQVSFYARFPRDETQYRLDRLHKMGILQRSSELGYVGYQLISESYDVLALNALVQKDILAAVGDPIGRGKESDVYFGKLVTGEDVAIKIHRIGQNSFRKVRKLRSYIQKRRHISWLYVSRLSAESEYEALTKIQDLQIGTPRPIAQNRHMVVMSLINGEELHNLTQLESPTEILDEILRQVKLLFENGVIHCDLSEFNILLTPEEKILIIDFPQWEASDHPNAFSYLGRDLWNLLQFFKKNYNVVFDLDQQLDQFFGDARPDFDIAMLK